MFSCRQAIRWTLDLLERRLSAAERLGHFIHLVVCRHCRAHSRQVHGLLFVLESRDHAAGLALPGLSPAARARIAAAVADANRR